MDYATATNPQTGQRVIQIDGQWKPLEASATHPQTGAKAYKVDGQWVQAQSEGYSDRVSRTGSQFDATVRAGGAGPVKQIGRTAVAAGENALSMGSGLVGDIAG